MNISDKDGSMMQQAQQIWTMLDDMAQNNPQAYRRFIDKQMQEAKELRQPPQPHMCVHTKNMKSSALLYVNVCSWSKIPAPKSDTSPIPVSGGEIYQENIDGKQCDLITVAFNKSVLQEFGIDSPLMQERNMLINLALDYIEDQHKLKLSRSYVMYPKAQQMKGSREGLEKHFMKKYQESDEKFESELTELEKSFGPLAEGCKDTLLAKLSNMADEDKVDLKDGQNDDESLLDKLTNISVDVKANKKEKSACKNTNATKKSNDTIKPPAPIIQEIGKGECQETENPDSDLISENNEPKLREPQYDIEIKGENDAEKTVCVSIKLEGVKSVAECDLHVSQDGLELQVPDLYHLKLTFPSPVNEDEAQAKFQKKSTLLTLTIPVLTEKH